MNKMLLAVLLGVAPIYAAHAQSMPVSQFLAKAEALKKKGMMAMLSSDIRILKAEIVNSGKQLRAEQEAAARAGRKPATCIPEKASISSGELMQHFSAIPPAQRNMTVKAAFADLVRRKYPCPS